MLRPALGVVVGLLLLTAVVAGYSYLTRDVGPPPAEVSRNEAPIPKGGERPPRKVWLPVAEARAGDDLEPAERVARDFTAGGVSFSTSLGDLMRQVPLAVLTGAGTGKTSCTWDGEGGTRYEVVFSPDVAGPAHLIAQVFGAQAGAPLGPMAQVLAASKVATLDAFNLPDVESITTTEDEQDYGDMLRECKDKLGPPAREGEEDGLGPTYFYWWYIPSVGRSVALGKTGDGGRVRSYLLVTTSYRSQDKGVKPGR